jgi:hypothetical protein
MSWFDVDLEHLGLVLVRTGEWLRCRVAAAADVEAEAAAEAELNNLEEEQATTAV